MGNYSYLLYTKNCKKTIMDVKKILEENSNNWNYASFNSEDVDEFKIISLDDYAKSKHDHKFIQYLDPECIKTLQIISKNTTFSDDNQNKENLTDCCNNKISSINKNLSKTFNF